MNDTFETLFSRAVEIAGGSETKLAAAAGCSQNAIWAAKRAGRVSPQMAIRIEKATGGKISRHEFLPEIFGPRHLSSGEAQSGAASDTPPVRTAPLQAAPCTNHTEVSA